MTNVQENRIKIITFILLLGTSIFALVDIIIDTQEGVSLTHLVHEAALWLFSMIGAVYQFRIIKWQNKEMHEFKQKITELDVLNNKLKAEQENFQKKDLSSI